MANGLNGGKAGGAYWDGLGIGAVYPFAFGCWYRKPATVPTALEVFICLNMSSSTANANHIGLGIANDNTVNLRLANLAGDNDIWGFSTLPAVTDTWAYVLCNCLSGTDIRVLTKTRNPSASDISLIDMTGINLQRVGICGRMHNNTSSRNYFNGDVANPAVWAGSVIPHAAVVAMADGLSSMDVLPHNLCFHNPTLGLDPAAPGPNWYGANMAVVGVGALAASAAPFPRIQHNDFM